MVRVLNSRSPFRTLTVQSHPRCLPDPLFLKIVSSAMALTLPWNGNVFPAMTARILFGALQDAEAASSRVFFSS